MNLKFFKNFPVSVGNAKNLWYKSRIWAIIFHSWADYIVQRTRTHPHSWSTGQMMSATLTLQPPGLKASLYKHTLSLFGQKLDQLYLLTFYFSHFFRTTPTKGAPTERSYVQSAKMFRFQCTLDLRPQRRRVHAISDPTNSLQTLMTMLGKPLI